MIPARLPVGKPPPPSGRVALHVVEPEPLHVPGTPGMEDVLKVRLPLTLVVDENVPDNVHVVVMADWNACHRLLRQTMLNVFAQHKSQAVQQTLHAMGTAALGACSAIDEVRLQMPNMHRLPVNLQPFGLENNNEIFVPTDEPFGLITGILRREALADIPLSK